MDYPRILIVGTEDVFNCNTSLSLTVSSFFEGWPEEKVKQVICGKDIATPSKYVLGEEKRRFHFFFSSKKERDSSIQRNEKRYYERKKSLQQIIRKFIIEIYASRQYVYESNLKRFITKFNPDVVYSCSSSPIVIRLAERISRKHNIPFVPHFFDDWPNNTKGQSRLYQKKIRKLVNRVIKNSPVALCISDLMCREYSLRYNYYNFKPLMHSVYPIEKTKLSDKAKKRLLYAGSVYLGRYKTLIELSKCINEYKDKDIELTIYTDKKAWNEFKDSFHDFSFVHYGGYVSQKELTKEIGKSYGLVFVESFDDDLLSYTRLSMSTKIPEYLSSGLPILAVGNENQGSIAYLKENSAAYLVTNVEDIPIVIPRFLEKENWSLISKNAHNLFADNHHRSKQRDRFLKIMSNCLK